MKTIYQLGMKVDLIPNNVPIVDCRALINPWPEQGDKARDIVRSDPNFSKLVMKAFKILMLNDSIVIMCQYGIHRSGIVIEEVIKMLRVLGYGDKIEVRKGVRSK